MQNYNTIIGVISMRKDGYSLPVIQRRYHIGSSTTQLILRRFKELETSLDEISQKTPKDVESLFYPKNDDLKRKEIPKPDYQYWYDRIHARNSKVNIAYCWIEYRKQHPDGYGQTQFYEHFKRFVDSHYPGDKKATMPVERIPGEKMYIDWVGDQPHLLVNVLTGELEKVHIFTTTLGVSSLIYAEVFRDEKLPQFITGTVNAIKFYGAVAKYFVPDNLKAAIKKHSKDELVLQSTYSDLEDFYETIVLPPPPRKPKGKPTVEEHVKYLETHLVEKLKEKSFTSLEELNYETKKNSSRTQFQKLSRRNLFS